MADPFTIRLFVPEGDPSGVRIIDRMNWTGKCVSFPRDKWRQIKEREEFNSIGVYILSGPSARDDELPTVYVGQTDDFRQRFERHIVEKKFWDRARIFVSASQGLNRAHVNWLEHALYDTACQIKQCHLDNANAPREPTLTEAEKADMRSFLKEVLQILPLDGLHAFELRKAVARPEKDGSVEQSDIPADIKTDTLIVPAQEDGFRKVFLGENRFRAIRISGGMLSQIKYVAAYQSQPVSGITHWAEVDRIEPYGENGKYQLIFKGPAKEIPKVPFGDAKSGSMQGPRYTTLAKLLKAKKVSELFEEP